MHVWVGDACLLACLFYTAIIYFTYSGHIWKYTHAKSTYALFLCASTLRVCVCVRSTAPYINHMRRAASVCVFFSVCFCCICVMASMCEHREMQLSTNEFAKSDIFDCVCMCMEMSEYFASVWTTSSPHTHTHTVQQRWHIRGICWWPNHHTCQRQIDKHTHERTNDRDQRPPDSPPMWMCKPTL